MSLDSALQRVATIEHALASTAATALTGGTLAPGGAASTGVLTTSGSAGALGTTAPGASSLQSGGSTFASALAQASGVPASSPSGVASLSATAIPSTPYGPSAVTGASTLAGPSALTGPSATAGASGPGGQIVAAAETQIGQTEQPPGSNESPAIAAYRSATAGAVPGAPWCAYFASWAARQAGEPLGAQGEGLGSVAQIWSWAQQTGRAIPNGPGVVPRPGDLIVFGDEHVGIVRGVLPSGQIQTIEGNYENKVALNERPPGEATGYVEMS
jgi:hypothetical protein